MTREGTREGTKEGAKNGHPLVFYNQLTFGLFYKDLLFMRTIF